MLSLMVSASQAQSEVVHRTIPGPAEQAPLLVARSVTPPSPPSPSETMERGDDTASQQRPPRINPRSCAREGETIEGSRRAL